MAEARTYRFKKLRELIVEDKIHHSHGLYWEALGGQMYVSFYYSVYLVTDENYQPANFFIECEVDGHYLIVDAEIEILKDALIQAFKVGPINAREREEVAGMDITLFLKKDQNL